jgi:hypothetical protein
MASRDGVRLFVLIALSWLLSACGSLGGVYQCDPAMPYPAGDPCYQPSQQKM